MVHVPGECQYHDGFRQAVHAVGREHSRSNCRRWGSAAFFDLVASSSGRELAILFLDAGDECIDQVDRLARGRLARFHQGRPTTKMVGSIDAAWLP